MADDADATMTDTPRGSAPLPEFRIVVRRPDAKGPLAPYRLPIAVAIVLLVFGSALWNAVMAGQPDDGLLLRSAALGFVVWITTGIVSRTLGAAESDVAAVRRSDTTGS